MFNPVSLKISVRVGCMLRQSHFGSLPLGQAQHFEALCCRGIGFRQLGFRASGLGFKRSGCRV